MVSAKEQNVLNTISLDLKNEAKRIYLYVSVHSFRIVDLSF